MPGPAVAEARRRGQPEAAAVTGGDVGEDVAERVLGQDHVESGPVLDEVACAPVSTSMVLELDVGVVGRDSLRPPRQSREVSRHVRLVDRRDSRPLRTPRARTPRRAIRSIASGVVLAGVEPRVRRGRRPRRRSTGRSRARGRSGGRSPAAPAAGSRRRRARGAARSGPCSGRTRRPRVGRPTRRARPRRRRGTAASVCSGSGVPRRGSRPRRS
jgi:hypothetical protein